MTRPSRDAAPTDTTRPLAIALAGLLALAVAMGIGRFAFTPLLPMMLHDGVVDLRGASGLATANYLGYWLGAMACALQPWAWQRLGWTTPLPHTAAIRTGLVATVLLTLGMALPGGAGWWVAWRALAGVASALVLVYTAGWCLARLTALGAPGLSGVVFVGPGLGIAVSGLAASGMVAHGWTAGAAWAAFALLAAALSACAWPLLRGAAAASVPVALAAGTSSGAVLGVFAVAYGLAGFGYIVTATFLPVIARQALPGSVWLDLFWPLFGLAVGVGALLTLRLPPRWDRRWLLVGCYGLQASGVGLTVVLPSLAGFALGSLLLGLPFTAITLFSLQEARRLRPQGASAYIGALSAAYGLGQIAGPPMVAGMLAATGSAERGFAVSLSVAAGGLLLGAGLFGGLVWRQPLGRTAGG